MPVKLKPQATQKKTAVAYARVSTEEQEQEGYSVPAQLRLLHEYAGRKGLTIVKEFAEASTAKKKGRTAFNQMLEHLRQNPGTVLLVEKTDRLYRNWHDRIKVDDAGCEIHLVKEGQVISPSSTSTETLFHEFQVLRARNYSLNLSEEIRKGMMEKARQGIYPTHAPLGYLNAVEPGGRRKVIVPDPSRAELVTKLFEVFAMGTVSIEGLAKQAAQWGLRTKKGHRVVKGQIHDILRSSVYMGQVEWNGESFEGIHQPLVSRETFALCQGILDGRRRNNGGFGRKDFLFRGLVRCSCGDLMTGELKKGKYVYYHCTGRKGCSRPYFREERLMELAHSQLRRLRLPEEVVKGALRIIEEEQESESRTMKMRQEARIREIQSLEAQLKQIYDDRLSGLISAEEYAAAKAERAQRHADLLSQQAGDEQPPKMTAADLFELTSAIPMTFKKGNAEVKRECLTKCCSNLTFDNGCLEAEFNEPFQTLAEWHEIQKSENWWR